VLVFICIRVDLSASFVRKQTDKTGYLVRERKTGCFQRRLRMPDVFDAGKASAVLENGVVTLTLPKAVEVKRRRIAVEVR